MLATLYLTNVTPGDRREPLADTKCPPAAQRKQAKRACDYNLDNIVLREARISNYKQVTINSEFYNDLPTFSQKHRFV